MSNALNLHLFIHCLWGPTGRPFSIWGRVTFATSRGHSTRMYVHSSPSFPLVNAYHCMLRVSHAEQKNEFAIGSCTCMYGDVYAHLHATMHALMPLQSPLTNCGWRLINITGNSFCRGVNGNFRSGLMCWMAVACWVLGYTVLKGWFMRIGVIDDKFTLRYVVHVVKFILLNVERLWWNLKEGCRNIICVDICITD